MTVTTARVQISLRDGTLELEGSEEFVSEQLTILRPLVESAFKSPTILPTAVAPSSPIGQEDGGTVGGGNRGLGAYENVFAEADGKVQVLKPLPGNNKAEKMVNGALLLSFANSLLGNDTTPASDVRDLCKAHACLDTKNFAGTIKDRKELFLVSGGRGNQTIKLTVPGRRRAEDLAKQLG